MPVLTTTPDALRPYRSHGIIFGRPSADQVEGDCPFCGREGKFAVNLKDGRWKCRVCAIGTEKGGGNSTTFVRLVWDMSPIPTDAELEELRKDRKLVYPATLRAWGVKKSMLTKEWCIPGYNQDGAMVNLYQYRYPPTKPGQPPAKKRTLMPTATLPHGMFGRQLYDKDKPDLWIVEGPWDGMAAYEVLKASKKRDSGYELTGSEGMSVYSTTNVIAAPGVTSFPDRWGSVAAGKRVALMFDNDHPKEHPPGSGKTIRAGWDGMKYVTRVLANHEEKPSEVKYQTWGGDPQAFPHGHDVRDHLARAADIRGRVGQLGFLVDNLDVPPEEWIPGRTVTAKQSGGTEIALIECTSWNELVAQWQKAMQWSKPGTGLDHALAAMLAQVASIRMPEDQLWITVISPPSSGKTTLAEGLGLSRKWTKEVGTFRGFHSGFQTDSSGEEDHGLLVQVKDKTLIIKDGDTILKAPNRDQIFSEMRDAYDTNSSTNYRNKVKRDYRGYRFGVIICGTESMLEMDSSELGARFLMCIIMDGIDEGLEIEVNRRRFWQLANNRGVEANGDLTKHDNPEKLKAKQMTGGYVDYLRRNATDLLGALDLSNGEEIEHQFDEYARFVAHMRSRPSKKQDEVATREMSARLCSQLTKLGFCLAVVLNKKTVDKDVLERVRKIALDTSRGRMLVLCKHLYDAGKKGTTVGTLVSRTGETEDGEKKMLRHLLRIGVAETVKTNNIQRWKLTSRFTTLYKKVMRVK